MVESHSWGVIWVHMLENLICEGNSEILKKAEIVSVAGGVL